MKVTIVISKDIDISQCLSIQAWGLGACKNCHANKWCNQDIRNKMTSNMKKGGITGRRTKHELDNHNSTLSTVSESNNCDSEKE